MKNIKIIIKKIIKNAGVMITINVLKIIALRNYYNF